MVHLSPSLDHRSIHQAQASRKAWRSCETGGVIAEVFIKESEVGKQG